jgi:hypothetical protein
MIRRLIRSLHRRLGCSPIWLAGVPCEFFATEIPALIAATSGDWLTDSESTSRAARRVPSGNRCSSRALSGVWIEQEIFPREQAT